MASYIPLPYIGEGAQNQTILGHYKTFQKSGATASIAAGGIIASLRWAPSNPAYWCVITGIRAGWVVTGAVTLATPMDLEAFIVRGFTVDFTTASTPANLAATTNTNQMRKTMSPSQMGVNGPRICTTAVMSGQTATVDANAFAGTVWVNQPSGNATVTQAVGVGGAMQDLYRWTELQDHPPVLGNNEGVFLELVTANVVTGTIAYYVEWHWAEVLTF